MKTLAQIEPRTPIGTNTTPGDADSLFKITQPGSYYLTTNITGIAARHGIEIAASGVTLDLMGFELAGGVATSLDGVNVSVTVTNLAIRNGSVRNWGGNGVDASFAVNGQYQDLGFSANGGRGLSSGVSSAVVNCTARGNTGDGIFASQGSTISGCTARLNTGNGIVASVGCTISGCTAYVNTGDGIVASFGCTISGCTAYANTGDGIEAASDCRIVDNTCDSNGNVGDGAGIHVTSSDNRIEGNQVTDNDRGIDVDLAGNLIIRNSASGNTTDWDIVANNVFGPILDRRAPASAAVLGFSAASSLGSTDANANFSY